MPLLPVVLSFILGITVQARYLFSVRLLCLLFILSLLLLLLIYLKKIEIHSALFTLFTSVPFLFLGALLIASVLNPKIESNHIVEYLRNSTVNETRMSEGAKPLTVDFKATVTSRPVYANGVATVVTRVQKVNKANEWVEATGLVRLTVRSRLDGIKRGDTVRVNAELKETYSFYNPGGYDYRKRLGARSVFVTGVVKHKTLIVKIEGASRSVLGSVEELRAWIGSFIERQEYRNSGIIKALVFGDKSGISREVKDSFARTGTSHLLALSGLHIGTVAFISYMFVLYLLKRSEYLLLRLNVKKVAVAAAVLPAFVYALIAGFPLSATRAVVMLSIYALAYLLGRGRQYMNVLALAALLILVQNPYAVFDISFQLSFSAVAGIILITPRLKKYLLAGRAAKQEGGSGIDNLTEEPSSFLKKSAIMVLPRLYRWGVTALVISFAATVATAPLVALHFNALSTVTLGANLFSVPVVGIVVPVVLAAALLTGIWAGLASVLFLFADRLITLLLFVVENFSSLPWSALRVSTPTLLELLFLYLFILLVIECKRVRFFRYAAVAVLLCFLASAAYPSIARRYASVLRVTYISVGQGDSALLELPGGEVMLIDGGGFYSSTFDPGRHIVAPLLWRKGIKKIDYLVLSHAQLDHMGGLEFIAMNFEVGEFWWNGIGSADSVIGKLSKGTKIKVLRYSHASSGTQQVETTAEQVVFTLLSSAKEEAGNTVQGSINNSSLVIRARYKEVSFLFTGDIEAEAESRAVERAGRRNIRSTVLKAPHHASSTSSTEKFINRVAPKVVVVSVGKYNPFGFPHAQALKVYKEAGAKVYRTDVDGAVEVVTDGNSFTVVTYAP